MASLPGVTSIWMTCLVAWTTMAQSADTHRLRSPTSVRSSVALAPASTTHNSSSSKVVLFQFGAYITQTGAGAGGADISELYTASGYSVYGFGMQNSLGHALADDFVVAWGESWCPSRFKWLTYQTGAPTSGTITGMVLNLWDSTPTNYGAAQKPGGNVYIDSTWTGVYRVSDTNPWDASRSIQEIDCDGFWAGTIGGGTHWLDASALGTLTSGPWGPPETKPNMQPGQNPQFNGMQALGVGAPFAPITDSGNGEPGALIFQVEGVTGCIGTFCTSKPSSLAGCVPALSAASGGVSKSGAWANNLDAMPVPGGAGKPGILIFTENGLLGSTPINTAFGVLCLNGLSRAGAFPAAPGGNSGVCDGTYIWDLAAIVVATGTINVGDTLHIQAWYRDTGFSPPGNANFTNGVGPITVAP